ncbi:hypothetical protein [Kitasatospora griseola]|uniref:hypothetical protein n=1 Tax=Kitasatospora griseola TaxID=2064 RepID=UPI003647CEDF
MLGAGWNSQLSVCCTPLSGVEQQTVKFGFGAAAAVAVAGWSAPTAEAAGRRAADMAARTVSTVLTRRIG